MNDQILNLDSVKGFDKDKKLKIERWVIIKGQKNI